MKKWLLRIVGLLLLIIAIVLFWAYRNGQDRFPDYQLNLSVKAGKAATLKVGFAAVKITPTLIDTWVDANNDAQFKEEDGDTWQDVNHNGKFDGFWMAGFQNQRPAQGIHDDLWARAVVIDDGTTRLAMVSLDLIAFSNDNVIRVRQQIPASAGVTYSMVCSTHQHEGPDMIGMWGPGDYTSGVNPEYLSFVQKQAAGAVLEAVNKLRPAKLVFAQDSEGAKPLVNDTRPPQVFDSAIKIMQAIDSETNKTLGTLVVWGNHPEVLWSQNLQITSDYVHYLRQGLEKGVYHGDSLIQKGLGGTSVFINGCVGGLMTTDPDHAIADPISGKLLKSATFEKSEAVGNTLALLSLKALKNGETITNSSLSLNAKTIEIPLDNQLFKLGIALGVLDAGYTRWGMMRTEIATFSVGPASFLCVPGEIYPEIIYGGIEAPQGQDVSTKPIETPPLANLMSSKYKFILGLANDEIGYIVPKSQWDVKPPFTYQYKDNPYGEINSVGPETAPRLHDELMNMLRVHDK